MLFNYFLLAFSVSIDSLGIGITYGLRKTKISFISKIILFAFSFIITSISIYFGKLLSVILPNSFANLIGVLLLIFMGLFIIYQTHSKNKKIKEKKKYTLFFKSLGITIQIMRDPISSDLNNSKLIDAKEAIYLALALSMDSICIALGGSILGINSILFPFLVSIFQLLFLSLGNKLGKKLFSIKNIPENIWSTFSGILLILIGIIKLF